MKLKDRIKTYNFWVSLSSAVFLLLKVLGTRFGFSVSESLFSDIVTSLCGILVILGIIVPPTSKINLPQTEFNIPTIKNNCEITKSEIEKLENEYNEVAFKSQIIEEPVLESEPILNQAEIQTFEAENIVSVEASYNTQILEENKNEPFAENIEITSLEIDDLKTKTKNTLLSLESLFESNREEYIELLQNQINITQGK